MSHLATVTDETFKTEILECPSPVLVDFWAAWCGPCMMMSPVLDSVSQKYPDKLKIMKLNVDENPRSTVEYHVMNIPTMILFKDGKEVGRCSGYMPEKGLTGFLSKYIKLEE